MPSFTDEYTFEIEASFDINAGEEVPDEEAPEHKFGIADGGKEAEKCAVRNMLTGSFTVTSPSADNHLSLIHISSETFRCRYPASYNRRI